MSLEEKTASIEEKRVGTEPEGEDATAIHVRHLAEEERQLVRKLDMRIMPMACILYLFACECLFQDQPSPGALNGVLVRSDLDRTNLGNARLQGLPKDVLHGDPTGVLFDWVNSAFFFSYVSRFLLQFWLHSSLGPPDSLPSPCYGPIQALPSSHLARMCSGRMGPLLCAYGAYTYPVLCFRVVLSHNIVDVVQLCRALCRACWTGRV